MSSAGSTGHGRKTEIIGETGKAGQARQVEGKSGWQEKEVLGFPNRRFCTEFGSTAIGARARRLRMSLLRSAIGE
jgi:hypothetical protein